MSARWTVKLLKRDVAPERVDAQRTFTLSERAARMKAQELARLHSTAVQEQAAETTLVVDARAYYTDADARQSTRARGPGQRAMIPAGYRKGAHVCMAQQPATVGVVTRVHRGSDWVDIRWPGMAQPMRQEDAAFWIGSGRLRLVSGAEMKPVKKIWACMIRRENGATDVLHLCQACQNTTRDFATIEKREPIPGRCDRCAAESS